MQALSEQSWDLRALEPTVSWDLPGSYRKAQLHQIRSPALDLVFTGLYHSSLEGDFSLKSSEFNVMDEISENSADEMPGD